MPSVERIVTFQSLVVSLCIMHCVCVCMFVGMLVPGSQRHSLPLYQLLLIPDSTGLLLLGTLGCQPLSLPAHSRYWMYYW